MEIDWSWLCPFDPSADIRLLTRLLNLYRWFTGFGANYKGEQRE